MIKKIADMNNNNPIKYLIKNDMKITNRNDIANILADNFSPNFASKNQIKKL